MENPVMTDADVAAFFGIAKKTLPRRVKTPAKGEIHLNDAHPQTIGGRRFWIRENVERLAGIRRTAR